MRESELLTQQECRGIFDQVMGFARSAGVEDIEVTLSATAAALTRFANNAIHQSVSERRRQLWVRPVLEGRTARAGTNRLGKDSIRRAVEEAVALTRAQDPDPELLPLAEPAAIPDVDRFYPSTAASTPAGRARAVAEAIHRVETASQTAAGICAASQAVEAILNSRGLFAYYGDTLAQFSITAMGRDSSGWAKASEPELNRISPVELAERASAKAALSQTPRELPAGRYTVILEPAAVQDLVGQMF